MPIETIPEAQLSRMLSERDTYFESAIADRDSFDYRRAEIGFKNMYRHISGNRDVPVVWLDGPSHCIMASTILEGQLEGQLKDQLEGQLWDQLWGQLRGQLRGQLEGQLGVQLEGAVCGGWWPAWALFYQQLSTIDGVVYDPELITKAKDCLDALTCTFWIPLKGIVLASKPHVELHRDHRGGLHNPTGPAWVWGDGTAIHALQGVRVPEWVPTCTVASKFLELENMEQRRVAFENFGWDRTVDDLDLEIVDEADPETGHLYKLPPFLADDTGDHLLIVKNSSPHPDGEHRRYGITVVAERMEELTAVGAQASINSLSVAEQRLMGTQT